MASSSFIDDSDLTLLLGERLLNSIVEDQSQSQQSTGTFPPSPVPATSLSASSSAAGFFSVRTVIAVPCLLHPGPAVFLSLSSQESSNPLYHRPPALAPAAPISIDPFHSRSSSSFIASSPPVLASPPASCSSFSAPSAPPAFPASSIAAFYPHLMNAVTMNLMVGNDE